MLYIYWHLTSHSCPMTLILLICAFFIWKNRHIKASKQYKNLPWKQWLHFHSNPGRSHTIWNINFASWPIKWNETVFTWKRGSVQSVDGADFPWGSPSRIAGRASQESLLLFILVCVSKFYLYHLLLMSYVINKSHTKPKGMPGLSKWHNG